MKETELERPLNMAEAAEYLRLKKSYLYHLVRDKKITSHKPGGKLLYFSIKDLNAYAFRNRDLADFEVNRQAEDILNEREKTK